MQTERPIDKEVEELLEGVELLQMTLVEQRIDTPAALANISESVREALRQVEGFPQVWASKLSSRLRRLLPR